MKDMLDLASCEIIQAPSDLAGWPATVTITRLDMDPRGGLAFTFDQAIPERWKWPSNPDNPDDHYQFTVWAIVRVNGRWYASGFVQMWQGRSMTDGSLPPILRGSENWWGDPRHLWGPMSDYQPEAGDEVGFFISAGNARLTETVTSVRERSNVVSVRLPWNDTGVFPFDVDAPGGIDVPVPSEPPAPPVPLPIPPADADAAMIAVLLRTIVQRLDAQDADFADFVQFVSHIAKTVKAPSYEGTLSKANKIVLTPVKP